MYDNITVYIKNVGRILFLVAHVPCMIQRANYGNKSVVNATFNRENLFSFALSST